MTDDQIKALIALLVSTGYVNVTCQTEFSPPWITIDTVAGLQIVLSYDQYQQIRKAAGLPDDVCRENSES